MIVLIKRMGLFFLFIYIMSLFIFSYHENLNIISKAVFLIFALFVLIYIFLKGEFVKTKAYIYFYLMSFLALISYFFAINKSVAVSGNVTFFQLILLSILIINLIDDIASIKICIKAIFIGGLIMCIYSVFLYGINGIIQALMLGQRLGGEINQENTFGMYSSTTFLIAMYYALYEYKPKYYFIAIIPFIFGLASGSRGAVLLMVVGITILICYKISNKIIINIFIITIISIALISLLNYYSTKYLIFERFGYFINFLLGNNEFVDNSILLRFKMINFGFYNFIQKPILGYGTGQYNELYLRAFGQFRPSHNEFIQILVNYGIVGFVIYYGMFLNIIYKLYKILAIRRSVSILLFTIFIVFLVNNISTNLFTDKFTYIYLALGFSYLNCNKKLFYSEN